MISENGADALICGLSDIENPLFINLWETHNPQLTLKFRISRRIKDGAFLSAATGDRRLQVFSKRDTPSKHHKRDEDIKRYEPQKGVGVGHDF